MERTEEELQNNNINLEKTRGKIGKIEDNELEAGEYYNPASDLTIEFEFISESVGDEIITSDIIEEYETNYGGLELSEPELQAKYTEYFKNLNEIKIDLRFYETKIKNLDIKNTKLKLNETDIQNKINEANNNITDPKFKTEIQENEIMNGEYSRTYKYIENMKNNYYELQQKYNGEWGKCRPSEINAIIKRIQNETFSIENLIKQFKIKGFSSWKMGKYADVYNFIKKPVRYFYEAMPWHTWKDTPNETEINEMIKKYNKLQNDELPKIRDERISPIQEIQPVNTSFMKKIRKWGTWRNSSSKIHTSHQNEIEMTKKKKAVQNRRVGIRIIRADSPATPTETPIEGNEPTMSQTEHDMIMASQKSGDRFNSHYERVAGEIRNVEGLPNPAKVARFSKFFTVAGIGIAVWVTIDVVGNIIDVNALRKFLTKYVVHMPYSGYLDELHRSDEWTVGLSMLSLSAGSPLSLAGMILGFQLKYYIYGKRLKGKLNDAEHEFYSATKYYQQDWQILTKIERDKIISNMLDEDQKKNLEAMEDDERTTALIKMDKEEQTKAFELISLNYQIATLSYMINNEYTTTGYTILLEMSIENQVDILLNMIFDNLMIMLDQMLIQEKAAVLYFMGNHQVRYAAMNAMDDEIKEAVNAAITILEEENGRRLTEDDNGRRLTGDDNGLRLTEDDSKLTEDDANYDLQNNLVKVLKINYSRHYIDIYISALISYYLPDKNFVYRWSKNNIITGKNLTNYLKNNYISINDYHTVLYENYYKKMFEIDKNGNMPFYFKDILIITKLIFSTGYFSPEIKTYLQISNEKLHFYNVDIYNFNTIKTDYVKILNTPRAIILYFIETPKDEIINIIKKIFSNFMINNIKNITYYEAIDRISDNFNYNYETYKIDIVLYSESKKIKSNEKYFREYRDKYYDLHLKSYTYNNINTNTEKLNLDISLEIRQLLCEEIINLSLNSNIALQLYLPNIYPQEPNLPITLHINNILKYINENNDDLFLGILLLKLLEINNESPYFFNIILENTLDFFYDEDKTGYNEELEICKKLNLQEANSNYLTYILIYKYYKYFPNYGDEWIKLLSLNFNQTDYDNLKEYIMDNETNSKNDTIYLIEKISINELRQIRIISIFNETYTTDFIQNEKTYEKLLRNLTKDNYSNYALELELSKLNIQETNKKYGKYPNNLIEDIMYVNNAICIILKPGYSFKKDDFKFLIIHNSESPNDNPPSKTKISEDMIDIKYTKIIINYTLKDLEILEINYRKNNNIYFEYYPLPEINVNYKRINNTFLDFNYNNKQLNWTIPRNNLISIHNVSSPDNNDNIMIQYYKYTEVEYEVTIYKVDEGSNNGEDISNIYIVNYFSYFAKDDTDSGNNEELFKLYQLNKIQKQLETYDCYLFKLKICNHIGEVKLIETETYYNCKEKLRYDKNTFLSKYIILSRPKVNIYNHSEYGFYLENVGDTEIEITNLVLKANNEFNLKKNVNTSATYTNICKLEYDYNVCKKYEEVLGTHPNTDPLLDYLTFIDNSNIIYTLYIILMNCTGIEELADFISIEINKKWDQYLSSILNSQEVGGKSILEEIWDFILEFPERYSPSEGKKEESVIAEALTAMSPEDRSEALAAMSHEVKVKNLRERYENIIKDINELLVPFKKELEKSKDIYNKENYKNSEITMSINEEDTYFYAVAFETVINEFNEILEYYPRNICINTDNTQIPQTSVDIWSDQFASGGEKSILISTDKKNLIYTKRIYLRGGEVRQIGKFKNDIQTCNIIINGINGDIPEELIILQDTESICKNYAQFRSENIYSNSLVYVIDRGYTCFYNVTQTPIAIYDYYIICKKDLNFEPKDYFQGDFPDRDCTFYKLLKEFKSFNAFTNYEDEDVKNIFKKYLIHSILVFESNNAMIKNDEFVSAEENKIINIDILNKYLNVNKLLVFPVNGEIPDGYLFISTSELHYSHAVITDKYMYEVITLWFNKYSDEDVNLLPITRDAYNEYVYDSGITMHFPSEKKLHKLVGRNLYTYDHNINQKNNYIYREVGNDGILYSGGGGIDIGSNTGGITNDMKNYILDENTEYDEEDFEIRINDPTHQYAAPFTVDYTTWVKIAVLNIKDLDTAKINEMAEGPTKRAAKQIFNV